MKRTGIFVAANTKVTPKISIPGPSCCDFRIGTDDLGVPEYKEDRQAFFTAIAATYKAAVQAFYAAGCRYLQMDDCLTSASTGQIWGVEQRRISGSSKPLWSEDEQEIRNIEGRG